MLKGGGYGAHSGTVSMLKGGYGVYNGVGYMSKGGGYGVHSGAYHQLGNFGANPFTAT